MEDAEKDVLLGTLQRMARAVSATRKLITDPGNPDLRREAEHAEETMHRVINDLGELWADLAMGVEPR